MHFASPLASGSMDLNRTAPMFNTCVFHSIADAVFVSNFCGADADGALAASTEGAGPDDVFLLAPDMSTPAATATTKLK
jgi:hypothetical protein